MRKLLILIAVVTPAIGFSQESSFQGDTSSMIPTALSIGLIFLLCIVAYLMYQREKLLKRNKELSDKLAQLQSN